MKKRKRNILTVDLLREIKRSFERFLSIFAIVAIGVAFFAGIKATSSVMKASADAYYDKYNLMDLRIVSNFGLTKNDLLAINKVEGVKASYATSTMTVVTSKDSEEYVMIAHGIDIDKANNNNKITFFITFINICRKTMIIFVPTNLSNIIKTLRKWNQNISHIISQLNLKRLE